ncbi:unnamed protein product, partial [Coregonus sp. 'balchen']
MDQLKVYVHSSNPDVLVITETWLRKSVLNTDVNLSGYNLFWQDRSSKGGKVAIFTKEYLQCSLPMSLNVDDVVVTDKEHMAELFNHHFIKSGFLFDSAMPPCPSNIS